MKTFVSLCVGWFILHGWGAATRAVEAVTAWNVKTVEYATGAFRMVPAEAGATVWWVEANENGDFHFTEVRRDEAAVYLRDEGRDYNLILNLAEKRILLSKGSTRPEEARVLYTITQVKGGEGAPMEQTEASPPGEGGEDGDPTKLDWDGLKEFPPVELVAAASKLRKAVFEVFLFRGGKRDQYHTAYRGFFIRADGLAVCPLSPLCLSGGQVEFGTKTSGGVMVSLKAPAVYETFPELDLALVKFEHQPARHLTFAPEGVGLGTWVALLTPPEDPAPVMGPVLYHGTAAPAAGEWLKEEVEIQECYSLGLPRGSRDTDTYRMGAPVVNEKGEVVAAFAGSQPVDFQVLRFGTPLAGFGERVEASLQAPVPVALPLSEADNPYVPAWRDPAYEAMGNAMMRQRFGQARQHLETLAKRYPDTEALNSLAYDIGNAELQSQLRWGATNTGALAEKLVALAQEREVLDEAPDWKRARYHLNLGMAYQEAQQAPEAIRELTRADELFPECQASMNLRDVYRFLGDREKTRQYLEQVVETWPSRIECWVELSKYLEGEASEACIRRAQLLCKFYGVQ